MATEGKTAIMPGYGYWDITSYPIGGCFKRAPRNGPPVELDNVSGPVDTRKGRMILATTIDGRRVAVSPDCVTR